MLGFTRDRRQRVERSIIELVNIRPPRSTVCAYCSPCTFRRAGGRVSQQQVDLISAWRESADLYSPRERAALAWTEHNTASPRRNMTMRRGRWVIDGFSEDEALALTWAVAAINTWNRSRSDASTDHSLARSLIPAPDPAFNCPRRPGR